MTSSYRDLFSPMASDAFRVDATWNGNTCRLTLTNTSSDPLRPGDLTVFSTKMPFSADTKVYGEGFNILSQYGGTITDCHLIGSYSDYSHYKLYKPEDMNQVYNMAIFSPEGEAPLLIGFSSCYRFNGCVRFTPDVLQVTLLCENATVAAGETIELEELYVEQGDRNTLLRHFADAIAKHHPKRDFPEIPTGWCSWLIYGPHVTAQNVYDNLNAIKAQNLDLKYIQIDDGFQAKWGDWFDFTDKFEGGVQKLCLDIKEKGFEPAIWLAPFVAEKTSKLFTEHPDWFVKDDNGAPLCSGDVTYGGWRHGPWYILDLTHPGAIGYVKHVFKVIHDEWQVKYFKLDAIVWASLPFGHRYDDTKTAVEAFKLGMQAILDTVGKDSLILGGNSPMWPSIGMVHAMRVTNDNTRKWNRFKGIANECFARNWQHNRFWINDPDTVLLKNKKVKIVNPDGTITYNDGTVPDHEFAFNAAYTMASGGMVLSGDDVGGLDEPRIALLKKLLPPTRVAAEFDDDSFTTGKAVIDETKTILYAFNFEEEAKDVEWRIDGTAHVLDLFEDKDMGEHTDKIRYADLQPHSAKVLICNKI